MMTYIYKINKNTAEKSYHTRPTTEKGLLARLVPGLASGNFEFQGGFLSFLVPKLPVPKTWLMETSGFLLVHASQRKPT